MFRTFISTTAAVIAALTLAATTVVSESAQAASLQLNVSTCDSFSLTGSAPNQVLNCVVSNAPTGCTIQGPATGTTNTPITLTAQCATGAPTSWVWTGGNCAGVGTQSCAANSGTVGAVIYSVTPSNGIGAGNLAQATVTWSNTPPVPPSGCTLSGTPVGATGGVTTLTASCSSGVPTSFAWTANPAPLAGFAPTTSTGTLTPTIGSTTNFSVTPSNAGGSGNQAATTVTVGGGGGGGPISCPGFGNTVIVDAIAGQRVFTGNVGQTDAIVVRFTTGSSSSSGAKIAGAEYGSPATARVAFLSANACDFGTPPQLGWGASSYSSTVLLPFSVGGVGGYYPTLAPNTTYYANVQTTGNCGNCNMSFDLIP